MSQNNHLSGVWILGSFIEQEEEEVRSKVKKAIIFHVSPGMANLGVGMC